MLMRLLNKWVAPAFCGAAFFCVANLADAQDSQVASPPAAPASESEDVNARLERLERQNRQLLIALQKLQNNLPEPPMLPGGLPTAEQAAPPPRDDVRSIVSDILKERDAKKAESEAAAKLKAHDEGSVVGSSLGLAARWNHGLWLESNDKAFKVHVGGRTQFDVVGVGGDQNVFRTPPGAGGIGAFDDSVGFRRARLAIEGTFWEVFNFNCEYDFLNTTQAVGSQTLTRDAGGALTNVAPSIATFNTPVPTDLWIEATHLPWIGNLRIGNQKPPIGFEHMTSSRFLNFMERSYQFDAFIEDGNNGFCQAVQAYNWTEDERATGALALVRTTRNIFGYNVGDGEWGVTARGTWLPYWADSGRSFVHLGLGGLYRNSDDDQFRFRARTELRNGPAALHNIVAITQIGAQNQFLYNPELVVQMGPFLLQAEYTGTYVRDVDSLIRSGATGALATPAVRSGNYFAQGGYVEALYFLTGEHRDYNKKQPGLGRVIPFRNAFWVPGQGCGNIFSGGAWQVGARYSYLDLNNSGINGGRIDSLTLGLNWFLNPNFKIQLNGELAHRDVPTSAASGDYQGVGMRFAFDF